MKFDELNEKKVYIRQHWILNGDRIPRWLLAYSKVEKEWFYVNPKRYIEDNRFAPNSKVGKDVRSATDLVEFNIDKNNHLVDILENNENRNTKRNLNKKVIYRDTSTEKLYKWSKSEKKWREVYLFLIEGKYTYVHEKANKDDDWNEDSLREAFLESDFKTIKNNKNTKEKKMTTVDKNYTGKAQIVVVHYINSIEETPKKEVNGYAFKADLSLKLKDGDIVIVDDTNGLDICVVSQILNDETDVPYHAQMARQATAWVVNKVNVKPHLKRIKATEELRKIEIELDELKKAAIKKKELEAELELLSKVTGSEALLRRREELLNS